jgi:hypothetical protein
MVLRSRSGYFKRAFSASRFVLNGLDNGVNSRPMYLYSSHRSIVRAIESYIVPFEGRACETTHSTISAGGRYQATAFFACALIFAQRFLAAFEILALPAADNTRFLTVVTSRLAVLPKDLAADCKLSKSRCSLANCFFAFFSSRRIAAKMLMEPPAMNLPDTLHSANPLLDS